MLMIGINKYIGIYLLRYFPLSSQYSVSCIECLGFSQAKRGGMNSCVLHGCNHSTHFYTCFYPVLNLCIYKTYVTAIPLILNMLCQNDVRKIQVHLHKMPVKSLVWEVLAFPGKSC